MPHFGSESLYHLETCHNDLIKLSKEVVKDYDCTVLCGHRSLSDQRDLFREGRSGVSIGKHNQIPALAVDLAPFPILWPDDPAITPNEAHLRLVRFYHFGGYVCGIAKELGIDIRWGGDWDRDFELFDQSFMDLIHFELLHRI